MTLRSNQGFTLLEMLVALAILAVTLTGALRALGETAVSAQGLRERTLGDWVAQNKLAELRATRTFPDAGGHYEGEATQAGQRFIWQLNVERSPNPLFRKVEVQVSRGDGSRTPIIRLSGYVVRPLQ